MALFQLRRLHNVECDGKIKNGEYVIIKVDEVTAYCNWRDRKTFTLGYPVSM
jgi:hypothetical protein